MPRGRKKVPVSKTPNISEASNEIVQSENAKQTKPNGEYIVHLVMGEIKLEASSDSLLEALNAVRPGFVRGWAKVSVENAALHAETKLFAWQVRKFMTNKIYAVLLEKRLKMSLR